MEKKNIIPAVMHLNEASELLKYELPDISTVLLKLVALLLTQYKIDNEEMLSALNIVDEIRSEENADGLT